MIINRFLVKEKPVEFEDDIDFSSFSFDPFLAKKIETCHVKAIASNFDDLLHLDVKISAKVVCLSAYTLKDVTLNLSLKECLEFTDDKENSVGIYAKGNMINIDEEILSIILTNIPIKVVGKNEKAPESGNGYRVINEEILENERHGNSVFDALDNLEL